MSGSFLFFGGGSDSTFDVASTNSMTGDHGFAFVLGEATPDAVWFAHCECMLRALQANWAGEAHAFCFGLAALAANASFAIRVEEVLGVHAATRGLHLPIPEVCVRPGEPGYVCHALRVEPFQKLVKRISRREIEQLLG